MPWPIADAWNQHLEEMNKSQLSQQYSVALVRIEAPFTQGWHHTEHVHPYWQMELVESAGFSVSFGKKEIIPEDGDILLIPPQNTHLFHHENGKNGWSIKFAVAEMEERYPVGLLPRSDAGTLLHRTLCDAVRMFNNAPTGTIRISIEHLIAAILDLHFSNQPQDGNENTLVRNIRKIVEEAVAVCQPITVSAIAAQCGCSTVYINRIFKHQMGIPVKVFIDQYRFETARKLLLSSGLNITEIATEMGFDDVFRFSRFFKRMNGASPSEYKKKSLR